MKKILCLLLAALLLLTGCQVSDGGTTDPSETTVAPTAATSAEEETTIPSLPVNPVIGTTEPGDCIAFANPGKVRIAYTGNVTYVKYIESVEDLPAQEALQGFDAEFFEKHALLIVVETVASGSVQLELDEIRVNEKNAIVSLKRTMSGEVGTADMATWMLWAEVEKGLEFTWCIKDRVQTPEGEKY